MNCLSCSESYILERTCYKICPSPHWGNSAIWECVLKCPDTTWGLETTRNCETTCPSNYYSDNILNECLKCHISCLTCLGGSETDCLSCSGDTNPYHESDVIGKAGKCLLKCLAPILYADDLTNRCYSVCPSPRWADGKINKCIGSCPSGFYGDISTRVCTACHFTCGTCINSKETNCLTCKADSANKYLESSNPGTEGKCLDKCAGAYPFGDEFTNKCYKECPQTSWGLLASNKCVNKCPQEYYSDDVCRTCELCDLTCETCSGSGVLNCRTCSSLKVTKFHESSNSGFDGRCLGVCVSPNPYGDTNTNRCYSSCPSPLWGLMTTNKCEEVCPTNYYQSLQTRECKVCHSTCRTCSQESEMKCLTCASPLYHEYPEPGIEGRCLSKCNPEFPYSHDGTSKCYKQCPASAYEDPISLKCISKCEIYYYTDSNKECKECHKTCETCLGSLDNECLSCRKESKLYHEFDIGNTPGRCLSVCPSARPFADQTTYRCYKICPSPWWGVSSSGMCEKSCPSSSFFNDLISRECILCDSSCLTCSLGSSSNCLTCLSGGNTPFHEFPNIGKDGRCLAKCATTYPYADEKTNRCYKICPENLKWGLLDLGRCVSSCPSDYYYDNINKICAKCDSNCKTCSDDLNCLSCATGLYLVKNGSNKICKKCETECKTVTNCKIWHNYSTCEKCLEPLFLAIKSVKTEEGYPEEVLYECLNQCPSQYFANKTTFNCSKCNENCKTCINSENECTSCNQSLLLDKNTKECIKTCSEGQFFKMTDEYSGECVNCSPQCVSCFEEGKESCLTCKIDEILKGSTCVKVCDDCAKDYNFTIVRIEQLKNRIEQGFILVFSRNLNLGPNLILKDLFNVSVKDFGSEFSYELKLDEDEKNKIFVLLDFNLNVANPIIYVNLKDYAFKLIKDENNVPLGFNHQSNSSIQLNITLNDLFISKNETKDDEALLKLREIFIAFTSFILFGNVFSYCFELERISTFWIYIDALQTISLLCLTDGSFPNILYYFLDALMFSQISFISFFGKTIKNNVVYYFGKPLKQNFEDSSIFRYLGTASFMCNGFQAVVFASIFIAFYLIKLAIIFYLKREKTDEKILKWLEIIKDLIKSILIRIGYLLISIISFTSFIQLYYVNNPQGPGTAIAALSAAGSLMTVFYFFKVVNNSKMYLVREYIQTHEPLFNSLESEKLVKFVERNHHTFIILRKIVISGLVVFLSGSTIAMTVLLLLIHMASIIKNALKNPFKSKQVNFVTILTDLLVSVAIILFIIMAKNSADIKSELEHSLKVPINLFEKQKLYVNLFIFVIIAISGFYFIIALLLFLYYVLRNISCILTLLSGVGRIFSAQEGKEKEEEDDEKLTEGRSNMLQIEMTSDKRKQITFEFKK